MIDVDSIKVAMTGVWQLRRLITIEESDNRC